MAPTQAAVATWVLGGDAGGEWRRDPWNGSDPGRGGDLGAWWWCWRW